MCLRKTLDFAAVEFVANRIWWTAILIALAVSVTVAVSARLRDGSWNFLRAFALGFSLPLAAVYTIAFGYPAKAPNAPYIDHLTDSAQRVLLLSPQVLLLYPAGFVLWFDYLASKKGKLRIPALIFLIVVVVAGHAWSSFIMWGLGQPE
jgi:hypothetical protein